jgi:hypothetical protein
MLSGTAAGTPAAQHTQGVLGGLEAVRAVAGPVTGTDVARLRFRALTSSFVRSILLARLNRLAPPLRAFLPKYCRQTQDGTVHVSGGLVGFAGHLKAQVGCDVQFQLSPTSSSSSLWPYGFMVRRALAAAIDWVSAVAP